VGYADPWSKTLSRSRFSFAVTGNLLAAAGPAGGAGSNQRSDTVLLDACRRQGRSN
jgi:hypothetical protein